MQVGSPLARTAKPLAIQVKTGRWFPVAVTLANTGEAVQGRLELRLLASGGQNERESVFYTEVELPANQARKRVWLYGRADGEEFDGARVTFSGRGFKTLAAPMALASESSPTATKPPTASNKTEAGTGRARQERQVQSATTHNP